MRALARLTVRASISLYATVALAAIAGLGGLSWMNLAASQVVAEDILEDVQTVRAAGNLDMVHDALRGDALAALIAGAQAPAAEQEALRKEMAAHVAELHTQFRKVLEGTGSAEVRTLASQTEATVKAYAQAALDLQQAALSGSADTAQARKRFDRHFSATETALEALSNRIEAVATSDVQAQAAFFTRTRWITGGVVLAATALLAVLGLVFVRTLWRRLGAEPALLNALTRRVAAGDLSAGLPHAVPSGSVADAMQQMQAMLRSTVAGIRQSAEAVAAASTQIAKGNQDLACRTEEQASALQQTAATMGHLHGQVGGTADSAHQAHNLAQGASTVAERGGQVVGAVVQTMSGINEASRRIADIIGTIDGIAFQTNILALNAAVEAARAGEQGRGFAVVAGEVRMLAQRSAEAAREIKALIQANVERVDQGTQLVTQAGATMEEIVGAIGQVTAIVGRITANSQAQSGSVQEVSQAVQQLDGNTQQNAALVEESAAAADSLRDQAVGLVQAVAVFSVDGPVSA